MSWRWLSHFLGQQRDWKKRLNSFAVGKRRSMGRPSVSRVLNTMHGVSAGIRQSYHQMSIKKKKKWEESNATTTHIISLKTAARILPHSQSDDDDEASINYIAMSHFPSNSLHPSLSPLTVDSRHPHHFFF